MIGTAMSVLITGMLGIFMVMGIIIVAITLLGKLGAKISKDTD